VHFYLCFLLDVMLLVLGTLRLTRLFTSDSITDPMREHFQTNELMDELLNCPFCIGFWAGVATTASLAVAGGPGDASDLWRWAIAPFALNYLVAHISASRD